MASPFPVFTRFISAQIQSRSYSKTAAIIVSLGYSRCSMLNSKALITVLWRVEG